MLYLQIPSVASALEVTKETIVRSRLIPVALNPALVALSAGQKTTCSSASVLLATLAAHAKQVGPSQGQHYVFYFSEILPNFALTFGNSVEGESQLDYVLLDGFRKPLDEFTLCFWMASGDRDNYGTPFSYATSSEDNEVRMAYRGSGHILSPAHHHRL